MCMTSFTPPPLAKFYFATVRGLAQSPPTVHSNCSERLWLHARTVLVAMGNYSGCPGELSWLARGVELKQFRTYLTYASSFSLFCLCLRKNANTTLSLQWPTKFGNIVQVETLRYLTKIATLWRPLKFLQPSIGVRYDCHVQLVAIRRN